jgi:hypothetical protein
MNQSSIFVPVGLLAFWTFGVLLLIPFRRFRGAAPADSDEIPAVDRAVMHLFELPVLFYVVCLMFFVSKLVTPIVMDLAWAYAGFRIAQTLVHVTYNNAIHRLTMFAVSNFILVLLWILFFFPVDL